jgi:methionyl-tRNA synthetase
VKDTYYLTTAIDYTNAAPHIGHAYEKVLTDAMARAVRRSGRKVFFLTGVDQHGQKIQQTAEKVGVTPAEHVAHVTTHFVDLCAQLQISNDGWAATTDPLHQAVVQGLLQKLFDAGEIYKKTFRGYYSVRQEQFITEKERREDGTFGPEWGVVEEREEENYYFRLAQYVPWLRAFLAERPDHVFPASRYTALVNALNDETPDLCISRPKSRLSWGIELPFDSDFVTFVWFDALTNYISFAGYDPTDGSDARITSASTPRPDFASLWPCDAHVIGKDILIPAHGVYWPIMLHAAGFADDQLPKLVVHGWWNIRGEKMSKSTGNVIDPKDLVARFGVDGLRYYLLADITTGNDSDFDLDRLRVRYESELANKIGNFVNRTLNMTSRYVGGVVPALSYDDDLCVEVRTAMATLKTKFAAALAEWQFHRCCEAVVEAATACNTFVDRTEPFKIAKDPEQAERLKAILAHIVEASAHLSVYLEPLIPQAAQRMQAQLNWTPDPRLTWATVQWGLVPVGHAVGTGSPLFPRLDAAV